MKLFVSALLIVVAALGASAQSPAELFGRDAEISDVDMSPSGNVIAFTQRVDGQSQENSDWTTSGSTVFDEIGGSVHSCGSSWAPQFGR